MVSTPSRSPKYPEVPDAAAVFAQAPAENFPVASRFLPRHVRQHLFAIYGFARLTDDIGDEAPGDRRALLDWLEADLERAATGSPTHPVLRRLAPSLREADLPLQPFRDLIEANRRDQVVHRYETFDDLVGYCMLSAAPVGRLVLAVFEAATPERIARSDDVCVALQVVEHLQDVGEDVGQDRVYLPRQDLAAEGCSTADLRAAHASPALRRVVAREAGRARALLASGPALAASLPLRPRLAVAGFTAGGHAALDAIRRADHDVLGVTCRPRPARFALRVVEALAGWPRRPASHTETEGRPA